jgi:two-component system OmpR family sensor kinase
MRRLWMPRSLQSRLLLTFLVLNLLTVGGLIAWTGQRLQDDTIEQAEHDLEIQSHLIADTLHEPYQNRSTSESGGGSTLASLVRAYAQSTNSRVTVMDENLQEVVSSDSGEPPGHLEDHPEVIAASKGTEQHDIRLNEQQTEERLYVAAPIMGENNKPIGYVQLSAPMAPIYDEMRQTWLTLFGVAGILLVVTAVASLLLARQIARPVKNLTATSEGIAVGHLERRVTPSGPDEIQRLGHAFNRMADRIRDMIQRQQEFVANAAHELRSPLTSLRLRLDILQSHTGGDAELTERYLREMNRELGYLQRVVEQLLTLSALDDSEQPTRAPLDLAPLLYEVADQMSPLVKEAGVELQVDVPDHLPALQANAEQMRIAVWNLLDNAIKYTPSGGKVTFKAESANGTISILVADTGVGIPPEALPHIFDRFYRVDKARSRRTGSGLGLALVRSIAEANGGRIEVTSQSNAGSVFTLRLPAGKGSNIEEKNGDPGH